MADLNWIEQRRDLSDRASCVKDRPSYPLVFKSTTIVKPNGEVVNRNDAVCAACWGSHVQIMRVDHHAVQTVEICPSCQGYG